jgi:hypothetical protein
LAIKNAGGNNDTKCLYFPLLPGPSSTYMARIARQELNKWDQLKAWFTRNFVGSRRLRPIHCALRWQAQPPWAASVGLCNCRGPQRLID